MKKPKESPENLLDQVGERIIEAVKKFPKGKIALPDGRTLTVNLMQNSEGWAYGDNKFHGPTYEHNVKLNGGDKNNLEIQYSETRFERDILSKGGEKRRIDGYLAVLIYDKTLHGDKTLLTGEEKRADDKWHFSAMKHLDQGVLEDIAEYLEDELKRQAELEGQEKQTSMAIARATGAQVKSILGKKSSGDLN